MKNQLLDKHLIIPLNFVYKNRVFFSFATSWGGSQWMFTKTEYPTHNRHRQNTDGTFSTCQVGRLVSLLIEFKPLFITPFNLLVYTHDLSKEKINQGNSG